MTKLLEKHKNLINFLKNKINKIQEELILMEHVLDKLMDFDPLNPNSLNFDNDKLRNKIEKTELDSYKHNGIEIVEGYFDGYFMVDKENKKYPVPLNYASKTKLIPGDKLKLKILENGQFVFKLVRPIERVHLKATLSKTKDGKDIAITENGKTYYLNHAAVTFFKGKPGDQAVIIVNKNEDHNFAALESIIKK